MGSQLVHGLTFLQLTLPGIAFIYNGDEIAMQDHRDISWDDTTDPWACNTNDPSDFSGLSRDPARTPFQWDATTNAGFNQDASTWLPVHPNYTDNNLAAQMSDKKSFYQIYKQLLHLRKNSTFVSGDFESRVLSENVFGYTRSTSDETFVILINTGNRSEVVNVNDLTVKLADESEILLASMLTGYDVG
jgi:alpha-glucosidase